jgi:hypothetical protein
MSARRIVQLSLDVNDRVLAGHPDARPTYLMMLEYLLSSKTIELERFLPNHDFSDEQVTSTQLSDLFLCPNTYSFWWPSFLSCVSHDTQLVTTKPSLLLELQMQYSQRTRSRSNDMNVMLQTYLTYWLMDLTMMISHFLFPSSTSLFVRPTIKEWDSSVEYNRGDRVLYQMELYRCIRSEVQDSLPPPSSSAWVLVLSTLSPSDSY